MKPDKNDYEIIHFFYTVGKNVREARIRKGLTQMDLALAIGHNSVGHIAKAELNKYGKHFNLEQLHKIAKILNTTVSELVSID